MKKLLLMLLSICAVSSLWSMNETSEKQNLLNNKEIMYNVSLEEKQKIREILIDIFNDENKKLCEEQRKNAPGKCLTTTTISLVTCWLSVPVVLLCTGLIFTIIGYVK